MDTFFKLVAAKRGLGNELTRQQASKDGPAVALTSSIRSIALSGKNRPEMYLEDRARTSVSCEAGDDCREFSQKREKTG